VENFFHFRRSLLSFVPDNDQLNTLQNLGQVFTQKKGTQLEGYFAKPTRTNLEQEMALQSAGPQNNKEKFLPWSVQDFTLAVIHDARALSIPAPTPEFQTLPTGSGAEQTPVAGTRLNHQLVKKGLVRWWWWWWFFL
jgi:hypothetical protein